MATVVFYQEADGDVPVLDWLTQLQKHNAKAFAKCMARVELLEQLGHQLRRPHADSVGQGLYELRIREGRVHYRILYSFHGDSQAPLLHGFTKERLLPPAEIQRALERKRRFEQSPDRHTYETEEP